MLGIFCFLFYFLKIILGRSLFVQLAPLCKGSCQACETEGLSKNTDPPEILIDFCLRCRLRSGQNNCHRQFAPTFRQGHTIGRSKPLPYDVTHIHIFVGDDAYIVPFRLYNIFDDFNILWGVLFFFKIYIRKENNNVKHNA